MGGDSTSSAYSLPTVTITGVTDPWRDIPSMNTFESGLRPGDDYSDLDFPTPAFVLIGSDLDSMNGTDNGCTGCMYTEPPPPEPECSPAEQEAMAQVANEALADFAAQGGSLCEGYPGSICVDLVIEQQNAGPLSGDGRPLYPNANPSLSRAQIRVTPGQPFNPATDVHVSPSCWYNKSWCSDARPIGDGVFDNHVEVEQVTSGEAVGVISISYALRDSKTLVPGLDGHIFLLPQADGSYKVDRIRDGYPSLGVYQNVNGVFKTLVEDHEGAAAFAWSKLAGVYGADRVISCLNY